MLNVWSRMPILGLLLGAALICPRPALADPKSEQAVCEAALMVPVNSLLRLIRAGLDSKITDSKTLTAAFGGEKWSNPFAEEVDSSVSVHLRLAFDKLALNFSTEQKSQFKNSLVTLVSGVVEKEAEIHVAHEANRKFFSPSVIQRLPEKLSTRGETKFAMGMFEGRVVFTGRMHLGGNGNVGDWLIDPFRTDDPEKRLVNLVKADSLGFAQAQPAQIFTWQGHTYYVDFHDGTAFDLATGENVIDTRLRALRRPGSLRLGSSGMNNEGAIVFPWGEKLIVVAAWNDGATPGPASFLGMVDLNRDSSYRKIISGAVAISPPNVNIVDGHPIVSWIPRDKNSVEFFDLSDSLQTFPPVKLSLAYFENSNSVPSVYSVDGQLRAILPYYEMSRYPGLSLGVVNIRTGKFLRRIALPSFDENTQGRLNLTEINGQKYAYLKLGSEIVLINLHTEHVSTIAADGISSDLQLFDYDGIQYMTWGTNAGKVAIYDLTNGVQVIAGAAVANDPVYQILPFIHNGEPSALVLIREKAPAFIRLLNDVRR